MGFFKAYDMRGTFGRDFDLDLVYRAGRELPGVVGGSRWLVGRDCRTTGEAVRDALCAGLADAGATVDDLGLCTTPMVYFFTAQDGYDGSCMVTASHNPPSDNGIKVSRRTALPVGYGDGLAEVEKRAAAAPHIAWTPHPAKEISGAVDRYAAWMEKTTAGCDLAGLRYAVDCSNGMASLLAKRLFPGAAAVINDTQDGTFPAHSPNPLKAEAREQLAALVREKRLDCGVVFDGDADRAMFVDEEGRFVQPDFLIPATAEECRRAAGAAGAAGGGAEKVLHDVRTSRGAIEVLREKGFEPVPVRVGHAFAKPKIRETGAICGGELAGHYYFRDFFGCDSGVLAALRILSAAAAAKRNGVSFSRLVAPVAERYDNSGELNFRVEDKEAATKRILAAAARFGRETGRLEIDGVRVEFEDGWVNVRQSNTEPYLRLVAERRGSVAPWTAALEEAVREG